MRVTGLGHRMKVLAGWVLVMMGNASMKATGRENAAAWNTITAGTMTTTAMPEVATATIGGATATIAIAAANPTAATNRAPHG
jgi:hypothetical protein